MVRVTMVFDYTLITMVFDRKSFFIWHKSHSIQQQFMWQTALYGNFTTVESRPLLVSKTEFLQQKFTTFSCKLLSQRAPS